MARTLPTEDRTSRSTDEREDVLLEIGRAIKACPEEVYEAMEHLEKRNQELFCMFFGLCGYRPHSYNAMARRMSLDMGQTRLRVIKAAIVVYRRLEQLKRESKRLPSDDKRDAFVMESLRQAEPMIQNFAIHYRTDFDDLYMLAAEVALTRYEKALLAEKPQAYLQRAIRGEILHGLGLTNPRKRKQTLSDHYQMVSLNKPFRIDSEQTLEDTIAKIDHISREYPEEVYTAIESLPEKYGIPLCMRYGLCGHAPHVYSQIARIMGYSESTVKRDVFKAVELLRERLSEEVLHG